MFNESIAKLESPCYDRKTKTDCPRRSAGCAVNCPDWEKYAKQRNEMYERNMTTRDAQQMITDNRYDRMNRVYRKTMSDRQNGKKRILK